MSTQVSPDSPLVSPTRPAFLGLPMASVIQEDLKGIRDSWFWFVLLGAALILLGIMALSCSVTATSRRCWRSS